MSNNKIREIFDFLQLEPDESGDMIQMLEELPFDDLAEIERMAINILLSVRFVKAGFPAKPPIPASDN